MNTLQVKLPPKLVDLPFYKERYIVLPGGRDSAKSHSIASTLVVRGYQESLLILCTRQIQNTIKDSVHTLLKNKIEYLGLSKAFHITDNEIRGKYNNTKFIFKGLKHNVEEIKSLEGVNICWVSEARTISNDSWEILIPTIRAEGSQFYIDLNPDQEDDPTYERFVKAQRPDIRCIHMTYKDNPFLTETSKKEIEYLKNTNEELYNWIYGGQCRETTEAKILTNIVVHDFDYIPGKVLHNGLDFGYIDANSLMQDFICDNELYIYRELYQNNLNPDELRDVLVNTDWIIGQDVFADSSRPEIISLLNNTRKFRIFPVKKSIGSQRDGKRYKWACAMYLKQFKKIHIHATNCPNAAREFKRWSWETTKEGKILEYPADGDDHSVDGVIYSLENNIFRWYNTFMRKTSA